MSSVSSSAPDLSLRAVFLQLAALGALAVGQPLLQMVRDNPEVLVVHHSRGADVLILLAVLFFLLPVILTVPVLLARLAGRKAGLVTLAIMLGGLLTLTLLPVLEKTFLAGWANLLAAAAAGAAFVILYLRAPVLRANLPALALVAPAFLILFLTAGPIRDILWPDQAPVITAGSEATAPVVFLVFDEFPVASLMTADHEIDCELFPNFCRLAEVSTWYPRATTISPATLRSVPAILTGNFPGWNQKPTLAEHPQNIFTLLAATHRITSQEALTSLCPPDLKSETVPGLAPRLKTLLLDLGILYQHLVVPAKWRDRLVPIADRWGFFLETARDEGRRNRLEQLDDFVASVTAGDRPALAVAHVLLPHTPFNFLPDGTVYNRRGKEPSEPDGTWGEDRIKIAHSYRCHLLQVCAVDRVIGRLLDRLEKLDILEETAIVVTADHGLAFRPGLHRRQINPGNEADIMSVPLFMKLPGQITGRVDRRLAQTVDIMPTLVSALDCDTDWKFDGLDLQAGLPDRTELDLLDQDRFEHRKIRPRMMAARDEAIAWKHDLFGTTGGFERLFTMSDPGGMLGRDLAGLTVEPRTDLRGRLLDFQDLEDVDPDGPFLPAEINGTITGPGDSGPQTLALALNGRLAGFTRTYLDGPDPGVFDWQITALPETFQAGDNQARLFLVRKDPDGIVLGEVPLTTPSFLGRNLGGRHVDGIKEKGLFGPHDWQGVWARWTDGRGAWTVPLKPDEAPRTLTVGIVSSGPEETELKIVVNGVRLLQQYLPQGRWETRLPLTRIDPGDRLTVEVNSSVFTPGEVNPSSTDRRKLGVAVCTLVVR